MGDSALAVVAAPRQLRASTPHFTGRTCELAYLDTALRGHRRLAVLSGPGGVGKTALALRWAQTARCEHPDGQLMVDLGGFGEGPPMAPGDALTYLLRALGVGSTQLPATEAEQAALYRSITAHGSFLIVLDNAASAAQVRDLLASSPSTTLVTSRNRLAALVPEGAHHVEVNPLSRNESVILLARLLGAPRVDDDRAAAYALAEVCDGLPVAMAVAAARLVNRPQLSLRSLVDGLTDEARRLRGLTLEDLSVHHVFDLSYRALSPSAAAVYRRLSLLPGRPFGAGPVMALLPDPRGPDAVAAVLDALVGASLLVEVSEGGFQQHALLRLHARSRVESDESEAERARVRRGIHEWYLAAARSAGRWVTPYGQPPPYAHAGPTVGVPEFTHRTDALRWLETERLNLFGASRDALAAGSAELAWHLCDALWPVFLYGKHYRVRPEIDQRGVDAAARWGNRRAEATMRKRLGRACALLGDFSTSERLLRHAAATFQAEEDPRGAVSAREALATTLAESGREQDAICLLREAVTDNRGLGDDRATGLTLLSLGELLVGAGRPGEALNLLAEAQRIFTGLAGLDPYNRARVGIALAEAQLARGDLRGAERGARRAASAMSRLGSGFERARALDVLGRIAERRGNGAAARTHYTEALVAFERLQSRRAAPVGRRLAAMGTGPGDG